MSPLGEPEIGQLLQDTKAEALGDEASGVVTDGQSGQIVEEVDAPVQGADTFGGLGGVLGDVASAASGYVCPVYDGA